MARETTTASGRTSTSPPQSVSDTPIVQRGTPTSTPETSDFQEDVCPYPLKMPQNDIIVLEYGTSCQFKRTISAELLYRYSRTLPSYCNTAKQLCGKYRVCDEIKEQLASLSSMVTSAKYKEKGVEDEIMELLERVRDHYPLSVYQNRLKVVIEATTEDQLMLRRTKSQCTLKANSKELKDMVLMSKLRLLDHAGMVVVCDRLYGTFIRIEAMERAKAEEDNVKALAQGRILLKGVSEQSVQSFVAWLEQDQLHCETDIQLYDLYKLSVRLGVDTLTEQCANQLFETSSNLIQQVISHGSSLKRLLGYCEPDPVLDQYTPLNSTVKTIFERVISTDKPPAGLSEMVTILLAKHMDLEMWEYLKLSVKHQFALQIVGAMVAQNEAKLEPDFNDTSHIKREDHGGSRMLSPSSNLPV